MTSETNRALREAMDQLGREAQANGLTPEILESILRDDEGNAEGSTLTLDKLLDELAPDLDANDQSTNRGFTMKFTVTIDRDEDGVWIVECPAILGCISQGVTKEEAIANIRDAIELCLQVRAERGMPQRSAMDNLVLSQGVEITVRRR